MTTASNIQHRPTRRQKHGRQQGYRDWCCSLPKRKQERCQSVISLGKITAGHSAFSDCDDATTTLILSDELDKVDTNND
ncbi:hypothetical protein THAOC_33774, partial [Thalassiosira oceanica]